MGNNGETQSRRIILTPTTLTLSDVRGESQLEKKSSEGHLPDRAHFILDHCPRELRANVKAMGKWLSEQNQGITSPGAGRTAINHLIKAKLLIRNGAKGPITAGPKLVV